MVGIFISKLIAAVRYLSEPIDLIWFRLDSALIEEVFSAK